MKIQPELLTKAAFKREIEKRMASNPQMDKFMKSVRYDLDDKDIELLHEPYREVRSIDSILKNKKTEKIEIVRRMRDIAIRRTINRMVRYKIVDNAIIDEGIISLDQVAIEHCQSYHSTKLIVETIRAYKFLQDVITELAKDGKPFKSKNHDQIERIKDKLEKLQSELEMHTCIGMRSLYKQIIKGWKKRIQQLRQDDMINYDVPINDICYKIVADGNRNVSVGTEQNLFDGFAFEDSIWYLSNTSKKKLIGLIVKFYKAMFKDEILEFRKNKNKDHKKEYMKKYNKKSLTAEDKLELVQLGKADGITQKEVAALIGCSVRTVQYYWNAAN